MAIPLVGVRDLHASPLGMGVLWGAESVGLLLFSPFAGMVVDRCRRRSLLLAAFAGKAVILASIPLAARTGHLDLSTLTASTFLLGALSAFQLNAMVAWLPSLVGLGGLVSANGYLEIVNGGLARAVWAAAGWLVDRAGLLGTLLAAAGVFVGGAGSLLTIPADAGRDAGRHARRSFVAEVTAGARSLLRDPILGPLAGCAATLSVSTNMFMALSFLYFSQLGLSATWIGAQLGILGVGAILGTRAARAAGSRVPLGPSLIVCAVAFGAARLSVPLLGGTRVTLLLALGTTMFWSGLALAILNVHLTTLRQTLSPPALLGRIDAAARFLERLGSVTGAIAGGALGKAIDVGTALVVAGAVGVLASLWIALSSVARLRATPVREFRDERVDPTL